MKLGSLLVAGAVVVSTVFAQDAFAVGVRIIGSAGYASMDSTSKEDNAKTKTFTGYDLGLIGQANVIDLAPGLGLVAGGGLRRAVVSHKDGDTVTIVSPTAIALEAGVEFSALPLITLQGLVGYDMGIMGDVVSTDVAGLGDLKGELSAGGQFNVSARALFTVLPFLSVGVEPTWYTGSFEIKESKDYEKYKAVISADARKFDYSGYAIRALASFSI